MDGAVNGHEAERGKKGVKAIFERTRQKKSCKMNRQTILERKGYIEYGGPDGGREEERE